MKKRLSALLLAAAMLCTLAACNSKMTPSPSSEDRFTPGIYTGEGWGFGGVIKVKVTLSADRIEKVEVTENSETPGIGSKAVDALPGAIVDTQSVQVDAIAGASMSSAGIIDAVTAALNSAGVDAASLVPVVPNDDPLSHEQTMDVDVVVVGAGGAGMTAGITAARAGRKVVILEKTALAGGNSVLSTNGINAAGTDYQNDNGWNGTIDIKKTLDSITAAYPELTDLAATVQKEYDAWTAAGSKGYFDCVNLFILDIMVGGENINDPDLVATLAKNSSAAINWLDSIGANLHAVDFFHGASVKRLHRPVNAEGKLIASGSYMVPILEQSCIDNGVEIIYNTPVTELLMDEGRIVGVRAEGLTVNAKAVILATGGFGADPEMVTRHRSELAGLSSVNVPGATGDGIKLAQAVGAATVDMDRIQVHPTVDQKTFTLIAEGLRENGAILVNAEGFRFCNEVDANDAVSAAELDQKGGYAWLIMDQRMAESSNFLAGYIKAGCTLQGRTLPQLAEALDIPEDVLSETISSWNAAVADRKDKAFGRTSFASALDAPPFYAIKVAPEICHTMGGVKISTSAQVLDVKDNAIPGLFAAGEVTGGIHGANCLSGNAVTDFVVFGRIAGESAAAFVE